MTDLNKSNGYPYVFNIHCPRCGACAEFRTAVVLVDKREWPRWESRLWATAAATDFEGKRRWFPGQPAPDWKGWIILEQDASLARWKRPGSGGYQRTDLGIVACASCIKRYTHTLSWPQDAFYRFELPQGLLWAWNRSGVEALIAYVASADRNPSVHGGHEHWMYLRHVPTNFLRAKEREQVVRRLRNELAALDASVSSQSERHSNRAAAESRHGHKDR